MRPVPFEYTLAEDLDHALALLDENGDDARPLAGGQSLVPMMNLRLARPEMLIDINRLPLDDIAVEGGSVRVGALVRHSRLLGDPAVAARAPVIAEGVREIAHPTIRNRGTIGGSIAHADPTAELPLLLLLLDGAVEARARGGTRRIEAANFFRGAFTTALAPGEMVTGVEFSLPDGPWGGAFIELAERRGDYAIVAVAAAVAIDGGRIREARLVCAGAESVPVRGTEAEQFLAGRSLDDNGAAEAGRIFAAAHAAYGDIRATAAYRRHLIAELTRRAVDTACARAVG